jgi:hypothetical protein
VGRQRRIAVAAALDSLARCRSCGDDSAGLNSPALTTGRVSQLVDAGRQARDAE